MDRSKKTLFELIGGIVTLTLIELAIVTILKNIIRNMFTNNTISVWISGILGMVIGIMIALHMFYTIDKALGCAEEAEKVMRQGAMLRMLVLFTIIVMSVCFLRKYIDLYILFLNIMNLKIAAYLVPLIDKWITKRKVRKC